MATGSEERQAEKRRPVFEVRYGRLRASVWRQESDKGPWFNVTLSRGYQDESGAWQNSTSFGARDLLELGKLCSEVHSWIHRELAKERAHPDGGVTRAEVNDESPF
jgi:hypothetical protein